jgi:hypothetical protein
VLAIGFKGVIYPQSHQEATHSPQKSLPFLHVQLIRQFHLDYHGVKRETARAALKTRSECLMKLETLYLAIVVAVGGMKARTTHAMQPVMDLTNLSGT